MGSALLLLAAVVCGDAEAPLDVGSHKQLFIDRRFIARSQGVELRLNPAQKLGILRDERGELLSGHVSRVIDDGGKVRLYLGADGLTVMESRDGLHFARGPSIPGGILPTVFLDPHDPDPARRWKLFRLETHDPFDRAVDGVKAAYSADGVHFTGWRRVLPFYTDNPTVVCWDQRIGKYVIYLRALAYDSENQRRIARIETDDPLGPWPYRKADEDRRPLPFFSTANASVVLEADGQDDPHSDIYYKRGHDLSLGRGRVLDVHRAVPPFFAEAAPVHPPAPARPLGGLRHARSATGHQPRRHPLEPPGPRAVHSPPGWPTNGTVGTPWPVRAWSAGGNYLYQYYISSGRLHDSAILRAEYEHCASQVGGVGVVRQRLDGFLSADADHRGGWLQTPPVTFSGNRLRLNIDTGAMGTAAVELRDADAGQALHFGRRGDQARLDGSCSMSTQPDGNAIVLCEGAFGTTNGKTAHGLVRKTRRYRVLSVIDSRRAGEDAGMILDGRPAGIPVLPSLSAALADARSRGLAATHFVIGLAPDGGRLPPELRGDVLRRSRPGSMSIPGCTTS